MALTVSDAEISERFLGMAKAYRSQADVLKSKKLKTKNSRVPLSLPNPRGKSPYYACLAGRIGISRWYPFPRNPRENEGGGGVKE
jgi:hypothetical protein